MPTINFSGLASGIDTNALIDATSEAARLTRVTPNENKVSELEDSNSALEELKSKLRDFRDMIRDFSSIYSGGIVKTATSTDETILTAVATSSANNGTYTVTVNQLAKNATYSFKSTSQTYTSSSDAIDSGINNGAGESERTVTVQVGTGSNQETVDIVLTDATTLDQFVSEFNSESTKAVASVVNVGTSSSPDYRVIIVSNYEGTEKGTVSVTVGTEITGGGTACWDNNSVSQAEDAEFSISGIGAGAGDTITRSSNTFSDVLPGITMTLRATGESTLQIGDDAEATSAKVQEWVTAYNEIVKYLAENNTVTREEDGEQITNVFAPLAKTSTDEGVLTAIRSAMTGASYADGDAIRIFADLGITTERDGTLKFDTDVFESAVANEPNSVRQILQNFGDAAGRTGGSIDQYVRFNGLLDLSINSNKELIDSLNDRIAQAEAQIAREEENMRARFARLESLMSQLQNQQAALTSALAGLG